jgi:hypothetical protein
MTISDVEDGASEGHAALARLFPVDAETAAPVKICGKS